MLLIYKIEFVGREMRDLIAQLEGIFLQQLHL